MKQPPRPDYNSHATSNTLVELLRSRADQHPDRLAYRFIQDSETEIISITYGELDRQARAIGAWLESFGASGERALLLYPSGLDYIVSFMGCLYAGVTAVPAYPPRLNRPVPRIQSIVDNSHASFALTTSTILHNIEQRFEHAPDLQALHWLNTEQVPAGLEADWRHPAISLRHAGIPAIHIRFHQSAQGRHAKSWQPDAQPESHPAWLPDRLP